MCFGPPTFWVEHESELLENPLRGVVNLSHPRFPKIVYLRMAPISYLASFVSGWFRRANE
jgi:hypothetical protein